MYLITGEQFTEIVRQENGLEVEDASIIIDLEKTISDGESMIQPEWYGRIMYLGEEEGCPIFTFTAKWEDGSVEPREPGENYLKTIARGIKETHGLSDEGIVEYFIRIDGVRGFLEKEELYRLLFPIG